MSSFPAIFKSSRIRVMHCSREIHIIRRCTSRRWDGFGRHGSAFTIERLRLRMVPIWSGSGLDGMMSMISSSAHGVEGFPRPNQAVPHRAKRGVNYLDVSGDGFSWRAWRVVRAHRGDGFFALTCSGREVAGRTLEDPARLSAVCRLQTALGLRPRRALSSAGAKRPFPVSVSQGVYRRGNGKRSIELIASGIAGDFSPCG